MSRWRAVAGAGLVLGLLVLPPAISAGQGGSAQPPATTTAEEVPSPAPEGSGEAAVDPPHPEREQPDASGGGGGDPGSGAEPASEDPASEDGTGRGQRAAEDSEPTARFASTVTVSIGDNFYSPRSISIEVGDTVTWVNNGQAQHSATASDGSFDTGVFGPGGSRSQTFDQPGSFDYSCTVHGQSQSGTVTVAPAGGGGTGGGAGPSEASAVGSAGAAGGGNRLPATGGDVLLPLAVGLALLFGGLGLRLRGRARPG